MNRIDDERVLFYLKHQQRIEEWAALSKDLANIAYDFLCSCEGDIGSLATELAPDAQPYSSLEEKYPKLFICRRNWFRDKQDTPIVAIGVEWLRSGGNFTSADRCAHTCVWVNWSSSSGPEFQERLSAAFKKADLLQKHKLQSRPWWPVYRDEVAHGEYWSDLAPYRQQVLDSIRFFWTTFAPLIDKSLAR